MRYDNLPGLAGAYLEDSFVLSIIETATQLTFVLDAALTPESDAYHPPRPGERHCYAAARLVFPDVAEIKWIRRSDRQYTDAAGELDRGNIDALVIDGTTTVAEGDWGRVRIVGGLPYLELDGQVP